MESVVLVDSCVFITLLKQGRDPAAELLARSSTLDLATCGMVRLEVLRGLSSPKLRRAMGEFLDVMQNVPTDNRLWSEAIEVALQTRAIGWNLPAGDVVIGACARRIGAAVLTFDKDFKAIDGLQVYHSLDELE